MKDFKLYTKFNFAKGVHLSLISVPEGNLCSSPEGISDFIKPYLQELQENTIIPDYLTLVSIQTIENEEAGVHILTFAKNSTEHFDDDDTASITSKPISLSLILLITYQTIPGTNTYIIQMTNSTKTYQS